MQLWMWRLDRTFWLTPLDTLMKNCKLTTWPCFWQLDFHLFWYCSPSCNSSCTSSTIESFTLLQKWLGPKSKVKIRDINYTLNIILGCYMFLQWNQLKNQMSYWLGFPSPTMIQSKSWCIHLFSFCTFIKLYFICKLCNKINERPYLLHVQYVCKV